MRVRLDGFKDLHRINTRMRGPVKAALMRVAADHDWTLEAAIDYVLSDRLDIGGGVKPKQARRKAKRAAKRSARPKPKPEAEAA